MKTLSKCIPVVLALAVASVPAQSRSLHITGTAGYLSEWELDGEVVDAGAPRGGGELVGRLVWKHVGLCSVNGPQERPGDIRIRLSTLSKVDAMISFDGDHCSYSGPASGSGRMDCQHAGGIPLSISIK
jgi:hypothetical protein